MRNLALLFTPLLAMLAACPALALERRVPPGWERNTPDAVRALHDFAGCVAHSHWSRARARQILAMDYRTSSAQAALRSIAVSHGGCLAPSQALRFNLLLFAGGLAEALLPQVRDLSAMVAYDPARPPFQARDDEEMMSLCTVRAVPGEVAALLATPVASAEETAALRAVAPQLGQCLRSGRSARVNSLEIRARLALAAWNLGRQNGFAASDD